MSRVLLQILLEVLKQSNFLLQLLRVVVKRVRAHDVLLLGARDCLSFIVEEILTVLLDYHLG